MRKVSIFCFIIYALSFISNTSFAQQKTYHFERINVSSGLKNEEISDFIKDNNGFIWIATYNGLYRYDGIKCKYFNLQSEKQQFKFSVEITCMAKSADGTFIIGTKNNGIFIFDPAKEKSQFCSYSDSDRFLLSTTINSILLDSDSIYIATDIGTFKSSRECRNFNRIKELPATKTYKLFKSFDGSIWAGTHYYGLLLIDNGKSAYTAFKPGKSFENENNSITTIIETNDSTLFLGTWANGLLSFNRKTKQFQKIKNYDRFNTCVVRDIAYDKAGYLWVGMYAEGLCRYSPSNQTFTFFKNEVNLENSLSNNTILRVFIDNSNVVWIGTWGGYACSLDLDAPPIRMLVPDINDKNSNLLKDISFLFQEPNGSIWVSSYTEGLSEYSVDDKMIRLYNIPLLSNNSINAINRTSDGTIWVGSCDGISRISPDRKSVTTINLPNSAKSFADNSVSSIYIDGSDNLWIGSNDGKVNMYNYKDNQFETFEGKINPGFISNFYFDKNNTIWLAGSNGLFKLDLEQKKIVNSDYYNDNNIPFSIRRILPFKNGNLILGTANNGLLEYSRNNNSFKHLIDYTTLGSIYDMKYDSCSVLWMASSNGLFSYNYKTAENIEHAYDQGIQKAEYSSLFLLQNNLLAVGGKGLVFFDPYFKNKKDFKPPVVFTDLMVMDKRIAPGDSLDGRIVLTKNISITKEIKLKYSEKIFTLSFTSLDYANPKMIEYRYKLEGFDKDWHYTDTEKAFATYTNLNNGKYLLIVEATNRDKQWNGNLAKISINIIPPFWRSLWFRILIVLILFWFIFSFYWQKLAIKKKEVERLKNEKLQAEIRNTEEILVMKNSELTSSVVHISNKNEILREIRRGLRSIKYAKNSNEINKTINDLNNLIIQNFNTDKHWEQFELHFNQLNHSFLEKLKKEFQELTPTNLKLCAYLKMNLSSKEIASLMNISPNAVLKSKYRLKQKFSLSKEQDIVDFILKY